MSTQYFEVTNGYLALVLVDPNADGYSPSWQSPDGSDVETATFADFVESGEGFRCQMISTTLTPRPSTRTRTRDATFCAPASTVNIVEATSFTLDGEYYQDVADAAGLSAFLHEHDTEEAYFFLGLADDADPPKAIGRVTIQAGAFGGKAREDLKGSFRLPVIGKPDIEFGETPAAPPGPPEAVTAGSPGSFSPSGSVIPANIGALEGLGLLDSGIDAAWTEGQYVLIGSGAVYWTGTGWDFGEAPSA